MCGIAGIVDFKGNSIDNSLLKAMCDAMIHRGPDDEGYYFSNDSGASVGLGHRRLSIIDLERGHQPIFNEDKTTCIVHNGMIYNFKELKNYLEKSGHKFKTNSDSEVIVHLYEEKGEQFVEYLRGVFSLAIWDSAKQRLILAKDFLGKKPLFYSHFGNKVIFASELPALLKEGTISKDIDSASIDSYLTYLCIPAPNSIYRSIKKVQPAHMVIFEKEKKRNLCYWQLDFRKKININQHDATQELLRVLKQAVKIRLISDVPLGVLLSGGVDSSTVVALIREVTGEKIKTFSVGFRESDFNELPYARIVAKRFDTEHHEFFVEPHIQDLLPKLVRHFGEPFADSSAIPTYYLAHMASKHVKVVLNGDGGDEVFIGYRHHLANLLAEKINKFPYILRNEILFNLVKLFTKQAPYNSSLGHIRRFAEAANLSRGERYKRWVCFYDDRMKQDLYSEEFKRELVNNVADDPILDIFEKNADLDVIEASLLADISVNLPNDLIVKMDIASMANSLEARSPFLDRQLIEFVASLPMEIKMKGFKLKYLLKSAVDDIVPHKNLYRPKKGFAVPLRYWFKGNLKSYLFGILLSDNARIRKIFNMEYVRKLVRQHVEGKRDYSHYLWLLLMLELWFLEFEKQE